MRVRRSFLVVLGFALLASACTGSDDPPTPTASATGPTSSSLSMEVASSDLAVGAPQHVEVGIFSTDGQGVQLLSFGQMSLGFSYLGRRFGSPAAGTAGDRHLRGRDGTPQDGPEPAFTDPNDARGVYLADVTFDQAGTWQVDATVDIPGEGTQTLSASFVGGARSTRCRRPATGRSRRRT